MIVRFNPCSEDLQRLQVGPIGPHLRGFAALVTKQNYCNVTGWLKVRLVAKFSRWLQRHRITLKELNEARIDRFPKDFAPVREQAKSEGSRGVFFTKKTSESLMA
jgi:hypothetical protein